MIRFLKTAVLSTAVVATVLATIPAEARDRYRDHGPRHHHTRSSNSDGDAIAAGILGLAVGAIVMGALAQPEPKGPVYRGQPIDDAGYFPPAPVSYEQDALEPWSPAWFDYCESRYRSFDAQTGTFTGYDGRQHFCVAG